MLEGDSLHKTEETHSAAQQNTDIILIDIYLGCEVVFAESKARARRGLFEGGLAQRPLTANLSVHRQRTPFAHLGGLALFAGLEKLDGGFRCEAFVVVVIELDHGGVGAGAEALYLPEGEKTVRGSLALLDVQVLLDRLLDLLGAAHHTGGRSAELGRGSRYRGYEV
jgi:hypothetical protein